MDEINESKEIVLQIGVALKKYRKEKNMSLDDLSELTGVSKSNFGDYMENFKRYIFTAIGFVQIRRLC
jgi:transcriptional regulator with XRE-family HTH domain